MTDNPTTFQKEVEKIEKLTKKYERTSRILVNLGIVLLLILLLIFLFFTGNISSSSEIDSGKFGTLGDIIGGLVGSLWALAGIYLFYAAIYQTRASIKLSADTFTQYIEEVQFYKDEIQNQRKEIGFARKVLEAQKFENTFFRLSNYHEHILNQMDIEDENKNEKEGIDCFAYFLEEIKKSENELIRYKELYETYSPDLNHYYKNIIQVLKYIKEFEFNKDLNIKEDGVLDYTSSFEYIMNGLNKKTYAEMYMSKLSLGEIRMIALHVKLEENIKVKEYLDYFEINLSE